MTAVSLRGKLCVPADHPSLPGHFPGRPVVPGVVLLDAVLALLHDQHPDARLTGLPEVKFPLPMLPGCEGYIELELEGDRARFRVGSASGIHASGRMALARG